MRIPKIECLSCGPQLLGEEVGPGDSTWVGSPGFPQLSNSQVLSLLGLAADDCVSPKLKSLGD